MRLHSYYLTSISLLGNLITLSVCSSVYGELPTFVDSKEAGPDYAVQGEYVGKVGGQQKIAAQVIALGKGKFEGILYLGGLPGAGWDGQIRFHFRGERDQGKTRFVGIMGERLRFENPNFQAILQDSVLRGTATMFRNIVDDDTFEMKKVLRRSPTEGAKPPAGAVVLFDGTNVDHWEEGRIVEGDLLNVGTLSKGHYKGLKLHLEFRTPFMPTARGMKRGNSGVYLKKEWEVQIVDSFGWNSENRKFERLANFGRCGGIHELIKPRVNMCYPPLTWQTYDIDYLSAKFNEQGDRIKPATMTIVHNGVLIHDKVVLPPTPRGGESKERLAGPLYLQDHGNPIRYRNIWAVPLDDAE